MLNSNVLFLTAGFGGFGTANTTPAAGGFNIKPPATTASSGFRYSLFS